MLMWTSRHRETDRTKKGDSEYKTKANARQQFGSSDEQLVSSCAAEKLNGRLRVELAAPLASDSDTTTTDYRQCILLPLLSMRGRRYSMHSSR